MRLTLILAALTQLTFVALALFTAAFGGGVFELTGWGLTVWQIFFCSIALYLVYDLYAGLMKNRKSL